MSASNYHWVGKEGGQVNSKSQAVTLLPPAILTRGERGYKGHQLSPASQHSLKWDKHNRPSQNIQFWKQTSATRRMMAKMLSIIFIVFISGSATANGDINNDIVGHEPEMRKVGNSSEGERGDGRNIPIFNVISFPNRFNNRLWYIIDENLFWSSFAPGQYNHLLLLHHHDYNHIILMVIFSPCAASTGFNGTCYTASECTSKGGTSGY